MEGKLFDDMPSAPKAPRLPKDFPDLHAENNGTGFSTEYFQNPKVAIPILMSLIGILIVIATKVFGIDMQSLLGESPTTITGSLASVWTSASEMVTNLPGNIKNLLPQFNNE